MKNSFHVITIATMFFLLVFSTATVQASTHNTKVLRDVKVPGTDDTFDISYQVNRKLVEAEVEVLRKSITFTFAGKLSDDTFLVVLPHELIQGPFLVWLDKTQITDFDVDKSQKNSILTISLFDETEQVTIVGSKIAGTFNPQAPLVMNFVSGSIDKSVYVYGETINISGKVTNPKNLSFVTLSILGPNGNTMLQNDLPLDNDLKFTASILTGGLQWKPFGGYTIKVTGKDANTFSAKFDFVPFVLPDWVKTNAGWWSNNQIDDATFATGLQYLIKEKIIRISEIDQKQSVTVKEIPSWIKTNAKWWNEGKISDSDFIKGIEYLIENRIIVIS
ncbi:MAG TPA: hypothetical protein VFG25_06360 [Nitrosopumilaceae archaeon]|nr:hypothetical protein [Nitrosopumilaceae archaeon]